VPRRGPIIIVAAPHANQVRRSIEPIQSEVQMSKKRLKPDY
jgi:hypothetical protein